MRRIRHSLLTSLVRLQRLVIYYAGKIADTVDFTVASKSLDKVIVGFAERALDQEFLLRKGEGRYGVEPAAPAHGSRRTDGEIGENAR